MARLLKDDAVAADPWRHATEAADLAQDGPVFVPLALWQAERERLLGRNQPVGLRLASHESPAAVATDLTHLAAIALEFPKFTDGRAYSHARLLRERYRFAGEVRAVGQVLRDQLLFMQRCGFDAFELPDDADVEAWLPAVRAFTVFYQPTADGRATVHALRHTRQAAAE